ncbi:MAG: hypothetical protein IKN83_02830 [Bacteroidaceae bacterium]|nr:hypothetical protein [Bacteroidaceae bacterium]
MKRLVYLLMLSLLFLPAISMALEPTAHLQMKASQDAPKEKTKDKKKVKTLTPADSLKLVKRREKAIAKQQKKAAKEALKEAKHPLTAKDKVYLFGVGLNFNDSSLYITEVNELSFVRLDKKTRFLPSRIDYSLQFKEYLEGQLGLKDETVSIFFSEKKKKASKWFYKMKKRYLDMGTTDMHIVDVERFQFKKAE